MFMDSLQRWRLFRQKAGAAAKMSGRAANVSSEGSKGNIYYLPAGRSVLRKTVPEVLSTARGRRPRAVLKTEGTVFLNTDRPRPANNIFIFFLLFFKR